MSSINPYSSYGNSGYIAQRSRAEGQEGRSRRGRRGGAAAAEEAEEPKAEERVEQTRSSATSGADSTPKSTPSAPEEVAAGEERDGVDVPETEEAGTVPEENDGADGTAAGESEDGADETSGPSTNPDDWEVVASSDDDKETDETGETKETDEEKAKREAAALAEYKKQFQAKVASISTQGHLTQTAIKLNINDEGYKRMMQDPQYEQRVLAMFRRDLGTTILFPPSSATLTVDGKTEKTDVSYANNLGVNSGTRTLLGTMQRRSMRTGLDALQSQVAAVLQNRLGTSNLGSLSGYLQNNSAYSNPYSQGTGILDKEG